MSSSSNRLTVSFSSLCFVATVVLFVLKLGEVGAFTSLTWTLVLTPAILGLALPFGIFLTVLVIFGLSLIVASLKK